MSGACPRLSGHMSLARQIGPIPVLLCILLVISGCGLAPLTATPASKTIPNPPSSAISHSTERMLLRLSLEQLANGASIIAVGSVSSLESVREPNGGITTSVTVSITQTLKGQSQPIAVIRVPGGVVNGQRMDVEDAPQFRVGERVVVFLEGTQSKYTVIGGFQGKFTVDASNTVGNEPLDVFLQRIRDIARE